MKPVQVAQEIAADPARIWAAFTEPEQMARWQADEVRGQVAPGKSVDLLWPALGAGLRLTVAEVDAPRRLVFESGGSRVTVELVEGGVRLTHSGLSTEDEIEGIRASWGVALAILRNALELHDNAARHVLWAMHPAKTTAATAHVFFTSNAALGMWLTDGATDVGFRGSHVTLMPWWREPIEAEVLANYPGRDVALRWINFDDSVLVMRTLPSPRLDSERLVALSWSGWSQPGTETLQDRLNVSLARLIQLLSSTGSA